LRLGSFPGTEESGALKGAGLFRYTYTTTMLKSLNALRRNRTTYQVGLLQAKAYRALKNVTSEHLEPFNLSTTQWAFLGLLLDKGGLAPSVAADELGVEAPFVTVMVRDLKKRGLLTEEKNTQDSRRKVMCLTKEGERFVTETEAHMRSKMRPLISGVSPRAFVDYLLVLEQIIKNTQKLP
jgi:DNA-binding MarR family transcriptional regulator